MMRAQDERITLTAGMLVCMCACGAENVAPITPYQTPSAATLQTTATYGTTVHLALVAVCGGGHECGTEVSAVNL